MSQRAPLGFLRRRRLVGVVLVVGTVLFVANFLFGSRRELEIAEIPFPGVTRLVSADHGMLVVTYEEIYELEPEDLAVTNTIPFRGATDAEVRGEIAIVAGMSGRIAIIQLADGQVLQHFRATRFTFTEILSAAEDLSSVDLLSSLGEHVTFDLRAGAVREIRPITKSVDHGENALPWLSQFFVPDDVEVVSRNGNLIVVAGFRGAMVTVFDARSGRVVAKTDHVSSNGFVGIVWLSSNEFVLGSQNGVLHRIRVAD